MEKEEAEEKEASRKAEKERYKMKYKVGDKVRVIKATSGCMGAEGSIGVVTDKKNTDGLLDCMNGFNIELKNGKIWRIGFESVCEPVEDELTAEEAIKILGEICCENELCCGCPIDEAKGKMSCKNFRRDKTEEVLEILKQWKKDHEKKEVEVESKLYCRIIDGGDGSTVRSEALQDGINLNDEIKEILAKYCSEHVGDYFAVCENRWMVKQ